MGRIEQLAEKYKQHIGLPWQQTVAGAQRVIMIVYDKELERSLMARKEAFAMATRDERHEWFEVDVADRHLFAERRKGVAHVLLLCEDIEDKLDRSFELARHEDLELARKLDRFRGHGVSPCRCKSLR